MIPITIGVDLEEEMVNAYQYDPAAMNSTSRINFCFPAGKLSEIFGSRACTILKSFPEKNGKENGLNSMIRLFPSELILSLDKTDTHSSYEFEYSKISDQVLKIS